MSEADKTEKMLLESMRKTKAGLTEKSEAKETEKPAQAQAPKKTVTRKKAAPSAAKKTSRQSAAKKEPAGDAYQSGRRVWPD